MTDSVTEQSESQTEAEELAAAMAGYNKDARGEQPPADTGAEPPQEEEEQTQVTDEESQESTPEPESESDPQPSAAELAEELKALKAKVYSASGDAETVRKLHGEIGNINRTLKELQTQSKKQDEAPVEDELTAAIAAAEEAAEDFPEMAGPIVKALKALRSNKPAKAEAEPVNVDERVQTLVSALREQEAKEALVEEHPDYQEVREKQEFKDWLAAKTPEYQTKVQTTWNPAVVSRALTEFKDSLKVRQKKQERLAAAVVTPGSSQQAKPSALPDEQGFFVGYSKGPKRLNNR